MKRSAASWFVSSLFWRSWRIVRYPRAEWDKVSAENLAWRSVLARHVLPLSLLPAVGWATGIALTRIVPRESGSQVLAFMISAVLTVLLSVLCVAVLGLAFYLLATMYETERNWNRAFSVAGYGTTPVLLAGALLVMPIMVMGSMVAMVHCLVLYYVGVQQVMRCKQSVAAEFVALGCLLSAVATGALGALGGAFGVL